jgi:hypothetical protein
VLRIVLSYLPSMMSSYERCDRVCVFGLTHRVVVNGGFIIVSWLYSKRDMFLFVLRMDETEIDKLPPISRY